MASPNVQLNNGCKMPVLGLGTYESPPGEVTQAVKDAIDAGYRHFDCAWYYENEHEIGEGIRAKIQEGVVEREDLFITSKLGNNFHEKECVLPILKEQLKAFGLDYLDLYLIHCPFSFKRDVGKWPAKLGKAGFGDTDYLDTYAALEELVDLGLTKSIGVSNFNSDQINRILKNCRIPPVVNQIEINPNINQKKFIAWMKEKKIVATAYCPLGQIGNWGNKDMPKPTILDEKVISIGKKYNKTPGQVVLNYLVSLGNITVIPKSTNKKRIIENINIFDFKLTLSLGNITVIPKSTNKKRIIEKSIFSTLN